LDDFRRAGAWLAEFHHQTEIERLPWSVTESSRWLEKPLEAYCRAFGLIGEEERLFAEARRYAATLTGAPLPIVLQHRDFTVWTILRSGRELSVLDWEGSRPGPALCDLLHYVAGWYEAVRGAHDEASRQRCFRKLLFGQGAGDRFCLPIHDLLDRYLMRLNMERRFLPLLVVYTWVELALRRADQQRVQGESHPVNPREGNRNFALLTILAEHSQQLFAGSVLGESSRPS
jgi:aminoglycoside phosphotransferase (APT) family kinase protein